MPINAYSGLMRSGKSYEVVSEVILPALLDGRDVVTNVDGINQDRIYEYLAKLHPSADASRFGKVRHVTNADVFRPDFFPYYDDKKDAHTDTIVQPGDLVAIDEAWRFWGTRCKLLPQHESFFLEHGHFTHPVTGVSCDLVLMIQDMGTLHRFIKSVVAFSFRTHKKVSLGLSNTYSVQMFEGSKLTKGAQIGVWVRRYKKEIFPLYSSFKGGAQGKVVNADKRQNILGNKRLWFHVGMFVVAGSVSVWGVRYFFNRGQVQQQQQQAVPDQSRSAIGGAAPKSSRSSNAFSEQWRIAGEVTMHGNRYIVVSDAAGHLRYESPSMFTLSGPLMIGTIEDSKVTRWSGASEDFLFHRSDKK